MPWHACLDVLVALDRQGVLTACGVAGAGLIVPAPSFSVQSLGESVDFITGSTAVSIVCKASTCSQHLQLAHAAWACRGCVHCAQACPVSAADAEALQTPQGLAVNSIALVAKCFTKLIAAVVCQNAPGQAWHP